LRQAELQELALIYVKRGLGFFAVIPVAVLLVTSESLRIPMNGVLSFMSLAFLGAYGGFLGGASWGHASLRVTLGGALAMAVTALIGRILGVSVG